MKESKKREAALRKNKWLNCLKNIFKKQKPDDEEQTVIMQTPLYLKLLLLAESFPELKDFALQVKELEENHHKLSQILQQAQQHSISSNHPALKNK